MENTVMNEIAAKARKAKSAEELLALAKENGMDDVTEESAAAYFEYFHKSGELSDEELDNVAGGGCHARDGRLIVTAISSCISWKCEKCGWEIVVHGHRRCDCSSNGTTCGNCRYCTYEKGIWYCNNPEKKKGNLTEEKIYEYH